MQYKLRFTKIAEKDIIQLKKSEPAAFKKIILLLREIVETPYTGKGKPKQLSGNRSGQWSRRITQKHRLVYIVEEDIITITIVSASSHYER